MAQVRQGRQNNYRRQTTYRNAQTVDGNTVRKVHPKRELHALPEKKISHRTRKNRDKAIQMNVGYVMFLCMALVAAGIILVGYIRLQSDITNSVKNISKLEKTLNNMKLDNEEEYSRIISSVNLEEIKRIAIQELGMTYANQGQIITYEGEGNDYVRQYVQFPE